MVRWHREAVPECLAETSWRILVLHQQLSEQLTTLATSVSQLDGAGRSLEQLRSVGMQLAEISEAVEVLGKPWRLRLIST